MVEQTDLPFASTVRIDYDGQNVGVAHVCGHDVHVTVALGVAATLAEMKARLPGTVIFVFQPAEEGPPVGEAGRVGGGAIKQALQWLGHGSAEECLHRASAHRVVDRGLRLDAGRKSASGDLTCSPMRVAQEKPIKRTP